MSFSTTHEQKLIADKYIRIQEQFNFLHSLCDKQHNAPYSCINWSYHGKVMAFVKSLEVFYELPLLYYASFYNVVY